MSTVTDNVSGRVASPVTRNDCWGCEREKHPATNRKWAIGVHAHCTSCHEDGHRACSVCGACMSRNHRLDRFFCSSTCRGKARRDRQLAEFERAVWDAEHPEEAAKQRAEFEVWAELLRTIAAPIAGRKDDLAEELKRTAARCAGKDWHPDTKTFTPCDKPFADGDVIYRRGHWGAVRAVLPYCRDHACDQPSGYHNRDIEEQGRYWTHCRCPDTRMGDRGWTEAEPCAYCGRLVRYDRETADPRRFVRHWLTFEEAQERREWLENAKDDERWEFEREMPSGPVIRTFCSDGCRRAVLRIEAKAKRLAQREDLERGCAMCHRRFTPRRPDARYCSNACRQRAYRRRSERVKQP